VISGGDESDGKNVGEEKVKKEIRYRFTRKKKLLTNLQTKKKTSQSKPRKGRKGAYKK